jgi:hypothetical protein
LSCSRIALRIRRRRCRWQRKIASAHSFSVRRRVIPALTSCVGGVADSCPRNKSLRIQIPPGPTNICPCRGDFARRDSSPHQPEYPIVCALCVCSQCCGPVHGPLADGCDQVRIDVPVVAKLIERPSQPKKEMRAAPCPSGGWFICTYPRKATSSQSSAALLAAQHSQRDRQLISARHAPRSAIVQASRCTCY